MGKLGVKLAEGACSQRRGWNDSSVERPRVSCRREASEEGSYGVIFRTKTIMIQA